VGSQVVVCSVDAKGCGRWGQPASCGEGKSCKGSKCECETLSCGSACCKSGQACDSNNKCVGATQWLVFAGEKGITRANALALDSSGNSYITGRFSELATFGSTSLSSNTSREILVAKLSPAGQFLWAFAFGGSGDDIGSGIAVDSAGNVYVTGEFRSTMPVGATTLTSKGSTDIFVIKLSPAGQPLWANSAGSTDQDYGMGIAVDGSGGVYITGAFQDKAEFGTTTLTSKGYDDAFVAKLSSTGAFLWANSAGGPDYDNGNAIAVNAAGDVFITGSYESDATFGTTSLSSKGYDDIFVARLSPSGPFSWATSAGGNNKDLGNGIALDPGGNIFVTGSFRSLPGVFGTSTLTTMGNEDIFVAKLSPSGPFIWATSGGGTDLDEALAITVDASSNAYITGFSDSQTSTLGSTHLTSQGENNIIVAKISSGGAFVWATMAQGDSGIFNAGRGIGVDTAGLVRVAGSIDESTTFLGGTQTKPKGDIDLFVWALNMN